MNAKKLKQLRKTIRSFVSKLPQRSLVMVSGPHVTMVPDFSKPLNKDGTLGVRPFAYTGTLENAQGTQRRTYRDLKHVFA